MWDPGTYLRYADERGRPFHDLVGRVHAERPAGVVDLGCGPGNLTATLARRWPSASVAGIDSSPEMIAKARADLPDLRFALGDVREWTPGPDTDVVISNATLQWVPGHADLVVRWARALRPGGWLAFQVPGNFDAPAHAAIREVAARPEFAATLAGVLRHRDAVLEPAGYARLLLGAGCAVDAWDTTYLHVLPAADPHPVLTWVEGTGLRPVRAALDPEQWAAYRAALAERIAAEYPAEDGVVLFPFRRIFVVAQVR